MPEALQIQCVHCDAKLRLGDRSAIGKRISCPKCQEQFVVTAPQSPVASTKSPARKPAPKKSAPVEDDWDTAFQTSGDTAHDDENEFLSGLEAASRESRAPAPRKKTLKAAPARVRNTENEVIKPTEEQKALARMRKENRWGKSSSRLANLGVFGWILGGTVGGGIGAAIWTTVVYSGGGEWGIIAWLLGLLTGLGVRIGSGDDYGAPIGWTAVVMALLSITFARFVILLMVLGDFLAAIVGACLWMAFGFVVNPYNFLWIALACFTAYRASMNDD